MFGAGEDCQQELKRTRKQIISRYRYTTNHGHITAKLGVIITVVFGFNRVHFRSGCQRGSERVPKTLVYA